MLLDVRGAEKAFGGQAVLDGVDLAVRKGEFVSLLGPSGCGKTTLLRIVAGLLGADRGQVLLDGADITGMPTHKRGVGVVFQSYALFPHLSVSDNVAFGLRAQGQPAGSIRQTVARFLDLVHLGGMASRSVRGLSGGQQQRVAVARALAVAPKLLLLDEPFSALDRKLRETMQIELKHLLREIGITTILVTHDQEEALVMSDRIAVMNKGAIEQFAAPDDIYHRPRTPFALGFVGHSTRLDGSARDTDQGVLAVDTAAGPVRAPGSFVPGSPVLLAVRPERISIGAGLANPAVNSIRATLSDIVFQGSKVHLHLAARGGGPVLVETNRVPDGLAIGDETALNWPVADTLLFPRETA
ncbi:polyamine-transporting ATPase [Alsobacter metallidurans]|uniref:Polyamine-transporting ATPase n=2 Tax=Alsobacter metallidurans TaxID=340221 RepID=A0A917I875_9HYPH|nr:polyamine-transporting ATPase [Alsobacter metallidurans]